MFSLMFIYSNDRFYSFISQTCN